MLCWHASRVSPMLVVGSCSSFRCHQVLTTVTQWSCPMWVPNTMVLAHVIALTATVLHELIWIWGGGHLLSFPHPQVFYQVINFWGIFCPPPWARGWERQTDSNFPGCIRSLTLFFTVSFLPQKLLHFLKQKQSLPSSPGCTFPMMGNGL